MPSRAASASVGEIRFRDGAAPSVVVPAAWHDSTGRARSPIAASPASSSHDSGGFERSLPLEPLPGLIPRPQQRAPSIPWLAQGRMFSVKATQ